MHGSEWDNSVGKADLSLVFHAFFVAANEDATSVYKYVVKESVKYTVSLKYFYQVPMIRLYTVIIVINDRCAKLKFIIKRNAYCGL